jgi:hypothetical protein
LQFDKRSQDFIGAHNETLSVAVSVSKRQARLRCRFASSVKAWRLRLSFKHRVKYWGNNRRQSQESTILAAF